MNIALILAGGVGKRSGSKIPKQFIRINDKPLIVYTLEQFEKNSNIDKICVTCVKDWIKEVESFKEEYGISKLQLVCEGGNSGLESLKNGLEMLNCKDEDYIIIHDAVRPFIDQSIIDDNINTAYKYGLAMASVECVETLVKVDENGYSKTMIPRDNVMRVQTPQTFKYSIIKEIDFTKQDAPSIFALYMQQGNAIYCSKGNDKNIKITYPSDVEYFKKLFEE